MTFAAQARRTCASAFAVLIALSQTTHANTAALSVCLLEYNLPYAERAGARGFDLDTAHFIAAELGRDLQVRWIPNDPRIVEIDESDLPLHHLAGGACDLLLSVPRMALSDQLELPKGIRLGTAYYGAAFELIRCDGQAPPSFSELPGMAIAIQAQTVAHYALRSLGARARTYFSVQTALDALARQEINVALLWGPVAGWHLQAQAPTACQLSESNEPPPTLRWDFAPATRHEDADLRRSIDRVLTTTAFQQWLVTIAARYGVPLRRR